MTRDTEFDLVIFDLDGTLVDSLPDITRALNTTFSEAGLPNLSQETVRELVGDGAAKLIERAVRRSTLAADPGRLLARFLENYATDVCGGSCLYPGILELLNFLDASGIATAVSTNKSGPLARQLLTALGIRHRFKMVIGDGDGFPRKPDPTAARSIVAAAGTTAARTLVVGDGLPDVKMAHAVPCQVIAAGWGYVSLALLQAEHPTHLASTVDEAYQILSKR